MKRTDIGGQAVIEGVMMRGIDKGAMANRMPDGTIDIEEWDIKGGKNPPWHIFLRFRAYYPLTAPPVTPST